jgi:protein involved in temperature-dependent protein secretion
MTLDDALKQGDYRSAVAILDAELKTTPDPGKLFMSVELKGFLEDFDGALKELQELDRQLPGRGVLEEFGHVLVNGRTWCQRQTVPGFRAPRAVLGEEFPGYSKACAEAIDLHSCGEYARAQQVLEQARSQAPQVPGELIFVQGGTKVFADLRDADDLTGPHLVCSHPKALLDIPFACIAELEFFPKRGYQDMLWKPARVRTWGGDEAVVRVYSYYVGTGGHGIAPIRQLRATYCDHRLGYSVGFGQRDWKFLAGDDGSMSLVGIHRVGRIVFRQARPA